MVSLWQNWPGCMKNAARGPLVNQSLCINSLKGFIGQRLPVSHTRCALLNAHCVVVCLRCVWVPVRDRDGCIMCICDGCVSVVCLWQLCWSCERQLRI